jgi:hypothetical protein
MFENFGPQERDHMAQRYYVVVVLWKLSANVVVGLLSKILVPRERSTVCENAVVMHYLPLSGASENTLTCCTLTINLLVKLVGLIVKWFSKI